MNAKNPIVKATFIVFATIWVAMNLYTLFTDPVFFWENIPNMVHGVFITFVGCVMGVILTAGLILFERSVAQMRLQGGSFNGVTSSIGPVPILAPPARRAKIKECLPIESERVKQWIEANKVAHPEYVTLFMAIWQTLSAHKTHPASHRKGGHGGRTLAQHCMAVADTALELAPGWSYEGVYITRPGKSPKLIIPKRNANYVFDPLDPIIPVLALAHDLGKIEVYKLQADGTVLTSETGSMQDDAGVKHDALGARILARISEFWELPPRDTEALTTVIAHYHHPSDFPVDKDGLSVDDRKTALMEFIILADKTTGQRESGISAATANEDTITETEAEEIYAAFVSCITEKGRINGTGDIETDKVFKIGQKHGNLIYLREAPLLAAMSRKLGVSIEAGRGRFILLNRILSILTEKGLLSTLHNGVNFKAYKPLFFVRFYHSEDNSVIASWRETIIISPTVKHTELLSLVDLPALATVAKIERPYFAHVAEITDPSKLMEMVEQSFGKAVIEAVKEGLNIDETALPKPGTSGSTVTSTVPATGVVRAAAVPPAPEALSVNLTAHNTALTRAPGTVPAQSPVAQASTATAGSVSAAAQIPNTADKNADIDWQCLDEEVKRNGFETTGSDSLPVIDSGLAISGENDSLPSILSVETDGEDLSLVASSPEVDLTTDDLDLVAVSSQEDIAQEYSAPVSLAEPAKLEAVSEMAIGADSKLVSEKPNEQPLGIPESHDRGTVIQDVPKDPISKYKKQKQEELNTCNLDQLRQSADPSQFLQQLASEKGKKRGARTLAESLGTGNDTAAMYVRKRDKAETEIGVLSALPEESLKKTSFEVFQRLVQRAVENGKIHSLAEIDGKYFILQSMIEEVFPNKNVDEQLPKEYVERRSTRAGTVLLVPVKESR